IYKSGVCVSMVLFVCVVQFSGKLQTPMYFFLSNLAFIDICFSSTVIPQLLLNTLSQDGRISLFGCATQMFISLVLGSMECLLLAVMSFDRYAAICKPLHYNFIINKILCISLTTGCWTICIINSFTHVLLTVKLPFCRSHKIDHFFCEVPPFFRISCTNTWYNEIAMYISIVSIMICSFLLTLISYIHIISAILKIRSSEGRHKVFSTCASHLTVVSLYYTTIMSILYYTTIMSMYLQPHSAHSPETSKVVCVMTTVVAHGCRGSSHYYITVLRQETPMYFFLCNLAFIDICFSTTIVPQLLVNTLVEDGRISLLGCVTQMFISLVLGATECLLLAVMSFDRYAAICKPLHYNVIMSKRLCIFLTTGCWTFCIINSFVHVVLTFKLPFCRSHNVNHFFCEVPPFFQISCTDTWFNEIAMYISAVTIGMCSFLLTLISYIHIISTIVMIRSSEGRHKVFSTCASHLIVVSLYYTTIMSMYLRPHSAYSPETDKDISILYTTVTPMLNPIVYSIRNKPVKDVLTTLRLKISHNVVSRHITGSGWAWLGVAGCGFCIINSFALVILTFKLPFCGSHHINHFSCEMPPFFRIACTDTWFNEIAMFVSAVIIVTCSFLLTLISYIHIIKTIIKIRSSDRRHKVFSTCASHLTVVSLYYTTIMSIYLRPHSAYYPETDKDVTLLYTTVTPLLNPIVYSIRNKPVKDIVRIYIVRIYIVRIDLLYRVHCVKLANELTPAVSHAFTGMIEQGAVHSRWIQIETMNR
ncbi:OLFR998, partial, partial [Pelobates cultripes]